MTIDKGYNKSLNTTINPFIDWQKRRKSMTEYRKLLKQQIEELQQKINNLQGDKQVLSKELEKLKLAEFEEDLVEETNQVLLKG